MNLVSPLEPPTPRSSRMCPDTERPSTSRSGRVFHRGLPPPADVAGRVLIPHLHRADLTVGPGYELDVGVGHCVAEDRYEAVQRLRFVAPLRKSRPSQDIEIRHRGFRDAALVRLEWQ